VDDPRGQIQPEGCREEVGELAALLAAPFGLNLPSGVVHALSPYPGDRPASCRAVLAEAEETVAWYPLRRGDAVRTGDDGGHESHQPYKQHEPYERYEPAESLVRRDRTLVDSGGAWHHDEAAVRRDGAWDGAVARGSAPPQPRPALPWVAALALLGAAGVAMGRLVLEPEAAEVAAGVGVPSDLVFPAAVAALAAVHLILCLAGRAPLGLAVMAPPLGWATLLGERLGETARRRAYVRTAALPGCTAVLGAAAVVLAEPLLPEGPALWPLGLTAVLVAVTAARTRGLSGAVARVLALPLWAAGTVLTIVLAVVLFPLAVLVGDGRTLGRHASASLASLPEAFRGPPSW